MIQINISYAQYQSSWESFTVNLKKHGFKWNASEKAWTAPAIESFKALHAELEGDIEWISDWADGRSSMNASAARKHLRVSRQVLAIISQVIAEDAKAQPQPSKRSWTREGKNQIVAEYNAAPVGTKKDVLAKHGISRSYIYRWEKREATLSAVEKVKTSFAADRKAKLQAAKDQEELAWLQGMVDKKYSLTASALARLAELKAA